MKYTIIEYNVYDDVINARADTEYWEFSNTVLQKILDDNSDKIFCGIVPTIEKNKYWLVFREGE